MTIAISSQMASSLVALTKTADDMTTTQNRLATGLAIASASDNIAVYFKAKSYSNKADDYDTVNKGISQAVANIDTADKALTNLQETLKGALNLMKDARAKATPLANAAKTLGDTSYGNRAAVAATASAPAVVGLTGKIVSTSSTPGTAGGAAPTDINDGTVFQQGDVFAITITDTSSTAANNTVTRYFRAQSTEKDVSSKVQTINAAGAFVDGTADADGRSQASAFNFNDMLSLSKAIKSAFGNASLDVNMTTGADGMSKLGFSMASNSQVISFQQTTDMAQGTGVGTTRDPGLSFNFAALFGMQQGYNAAGQLAYNTQAKQDQRSVKDGNNTITGNAYIYSPIGPPQAQIDVVLQARREAADFFKQTLYGVRTTAADASLPGFANLLKGEAMNIQLNDDNSVSQAVKLSQAIDPLSLGFTGYTENAGVVSTTNSAGNFAVDGDLDVSIQQVNNALVNLKRSQTYLAAAKIQANARLDYNKALVATLQSGANSMTAADSTAEAANLASLQNRQAFSTNNLSITKQAEQSLIQLLR